MRIVQAGLGHVDQGHGNTLAGARAPVGLLDVGPPRFVQSLNLAQHVGQAHFREYAVDHFAATFEHAEYVPRGRGFPSGQGRQFIQNTLVNKQLIVGLHRVFQQTGFSVLRVGLAQNVAFVRQNSIVVRGSTPQHGRCTHQAAFLGLNDWQVACTAGFACHSQVTGVDEADVGGVLFVQLGVRTLWVGRRRVVPELLVSWRNVGFVQCGPIFRCKALFTRCAGVVIGQRALLLLFAIPFHGGITTMAIGAAQHHTGVGVHGVFICLCVAAHAAFGFSKGFPCSLPFRRMGCHGVAFFRQLFTGGMGHLVDPQSGNSCHRETQCKQPALPAIVAGGLCWTSNGGIQIHQQTTCFRNSKSR